MSATATAGDDVEPTPWNVELPASHNVESGGPLAPCIDCFTCAARGYLQFSRMVASCYGCLLDCGGLLRLSDRELKSWGYRDDESQFGRFKGACGDRTAAEVRERKRAARRAARGVAGAGAKPQQDREQQLPAQHPGAAPHKV